MPLVDKTDVVRVDLSTPGDWVDLRRRLSKAEQLRISARVIAVGTLDGASPDIAEEKLMEVNFIGLEIGVVAWSFPEDLTPANLRELDLDDYNILAEKTAELWKLRTDDERKNLSVNGRHSSRAKAVLPKS